MHKTIKSISSTLNIDMSGTPLACDCTHIPDQKVIRPVFAWYFYRRPSNILSKRAMLRVFTLDGKDT